MEMTQVPQFEYSQKIDGETNQLWLLWNNGIYEPIYLGGYIINSNVPKR